MGTLLRQNTPTPNPHNLNPYLHNQSISTHSNNSLSQHHHTNFSQTTSIAPPPHASVSHLNQRTVSCMQKAAYMHFTHEKKRSSQTRVEVACGECGPTMVHCHDTHVLRFCGDMCEGSTATECVLPLVEQMGCCSRIGFSTWATPVTLR